MEIINRKIKMPYKNLKQERERSKRRRRTLNYQLYQKEYQRKWRKKNPKKWKKIMKKSESSPKRKKYIANWWKTNPKAKIIRSRFAKSGKGRAYDKKWAKENPEKVKAKYQRYSVTDKGILNRIKKTQKVRKKFSNAEPISLELIQLVNKRDKVCVYCRKKFSKSNKLNYEHLNPFKPFSKINLVLCCEPCNKSKGNANALDWCKYKGYKPLPIVFKLLKEQKTC